VTVEFLRPTVSRGGEKDLYVKLPLDLAAISTRLPARRGIDGDPCGSVASLPTTLKSPAIALTGRINIGENGGMDERAAVFAQSTAL
jgi:hypothetical protein